MLERGIRPAKPAVFQGNKLRLATRSLLTAVVAFQGGASLAQSASPTASDPSGAKGNYLEAAGVSVTVPAVLDKGRDANPLLNDAATSGGPTFQGNIQQTSNVPAPGKTMPQQPVVVAQAQVAQAQSAQSPQGQATNQAPAGVNPNNAVAQPLPTPKLDVETQVMNRIAPANSGQLRNIVQELNVRQGAAIVPPNNGFVGRASQYTVDLSPGATPPVVRVAKGMGATVNFVDTAGNPWPIQFANNFYAEAATVTQMAGHVLSVASNSPHLSGSVGVMLQGLTTPVNFIVTPAQTESDYRVDLRIAGLSPDAVPVPGRAQASRPAIGGATGQQQGADDLMGFMYGSTPSGSTRLQTSLTGPTQVDTRAWQTAKGKLIVRTAALIQSPGWYQRLPALDGTAVYELPATPVIRVSVDGNTQTLTIKGLSPDGATTAKTKKTSLN